MRKILDLITDEMVKAFEAAGLDAKYAKVTVSNRPDLCEYQCNGAMAAAKEYKKAPIMIAEEVVAQLKDNAMFESVEAVKPGFLNLKLNNEFVASYISKMQEDTERLGCDKVENPKTIMIDYGGPNVAKPLHVGHLRSAIIGESIKRIGKFMGHNMIGDVHLGDWGLQMGLIITELKLRKPELCYFDENYEGEYPVEPPFTISELEEIYPTASGKSKEDAAYKEAAMQATFELQHGRRGYQALLKHILNVSVTDLKKNYANLNVSFELWKGESDAQPYIPAMVQKMKDDMHASIQKGLAFIVDPIDGTTNFIKDYHVSAISVGLINDGRSYIGVVYNPYLDEMFTAERGKGAFLNGKPIHVSRNPLSEGIVLFGTAPYYEELSRKSFDLAYEYFRQALDIRRSGSAAIDLCSIAAGRAEVYFELRLSPWDYAAGSLIVEEAGGVVTTVDGGEITFERPCSVLAANGRAKLQA